MHILNTNWIARPPPSVWNCTTKKVRKLDGKNKKYTSKEIKTEK